MLDIELSALKSGSRSAENTNRRRLIAGVAAERWRIGTKAMALVLGRKPAVVTDWISHSARMRIDDPHFASAYDRLDQSLAKILGR